MYATLWSTFFVHVADLPDKWKESEWFARLHARANKSRPNDIWFAAQQNGVLHLPRFFPRTHAIWSRVTVTDRRIQGEPMGTEAKAPSACKAQLLDDPPQRTAVSRMLLQLHRTGGAMLVLPCGFGKTVCALFVAHALGRRALVLVHTQALLQQWEERIRTFLPDARVGRIRQNVICVDACDVVVAMIQTVCRRAHQLTRELHSFGTCIVDEAHHIAAPFFQKALIHLPCAYVIGLTATPHRVDGLGYALPWFLGEVAFCATRNDNENVDVLLAQYDEGAEQEIRNRRGEPSIARMVNALTDDCTRTAFIVWLVAQLVRPVGENRYVLLLTDRREHVLRLADALAREGSLCKREEDAGCTQDVLVGMVVGGQNEPARKLGLSARIIVSTFHFFAEGQDIPRLDTLVLCTPRSNIEQAIGRILRPCKDKKRPFIIDVWDNFSVFPYLMAKRRRFYKSCNYHVQTCLSSQRDGIQHNGSTSPNKTVA